MKRRLTLLTCIVCCSAAVAASAAEVLADPTRPPQMSGGDMAGGGETVGSRLTSVMLPKQGRPAAIISGHLVPLGGMIGEAKLVRVSETEAVLEGPDGIERLYLTPDVEKRINVTKGAVRRQKDKP